MAVDINASCLLEALGNNLKVGGIRIARGGLSALTAVFQLLPELKAASEDSHGQIVLTTAPRCRRRRRHAYGYSTDWRP